VFEDTGIFCNHAQKFFCCDSFHRNGRGCGWDCPTNVFRLSRRLISASCFSGSIIMPLVMFQPSRVWRLGQLLKSA
jgi:hypothetical protein